MTKNKLLIAFLLVSSALQTAYAQSSQTYRLPKGVTTADLMEGTLIFKLKPEFRANSRVNGVEIQMLNQTLAGIGVTDIQKVFPAKTSPEQQRNSLGQKLVDLSLIYEVRYSSSVNPEKAANAVLRTGLVEYAEPKFLPKLYSGFPKHQTLTKTDWRLKQLHKNQTLIKTDRWLQQHANH